MMRTRRLMASLILIASLVAGLWLGYLQIVPPAAPRDLVETPKTLATALEGPDMALMLSHIKAMASEVHSVDSPGIRQTQDYLLDQLRQMGYAPVEERYELSLEEVLDLRRQRTDYLGRELHADAQGVRDMAGLGDKNSMQLNNIVVTLDAPDTDETIIFVAHTDSVIWGPGAFDDIVAVASLMEGLRLLQGQHLARDLVFLFSDGEEQGLLGAAKFVADHPELQPLTRLVVNVEARGNKGALLLFETSRNNLNMISSYASAVDHPFGFSIARDVYYMMKNDTDLSRFFMADYPGINLAVVQGAEVYHTPYDNYDGFDRASAWHYLQTMTGLVSHLGTEPTLNLEADQNAVFFPLTPGRLMILPQSSANWLAYLAAGLFVLVLAVLLIRGRARLGTLLASLGVQLGLTALAGLISYLVVLLTLRLIGVGNDEYYNILSFRAGEPIFLITLLLLSLLAALVVRRLFARTASPESVALGVLLLPAALALVTTFLFPSASYLFSISTLLGLAALLLRRVVPLAIPAAAFNLGTLLLFVPLTALVFIALSFNMAYAAVVLWMLPWTMMLGLSVPAAQD